MRVMLAISLFLIILFTLYKRKKKHTHTVSADKTLQETHVRASGLEFVLVRPVALHDGENRGGVGTATVDSAVEAPPTQHLSRVDLAAFLIDQCASNEFVGQAPGVSWREPPAKK